MPKPTAEHNNTSGMDSFPLGNSIKGVLKHDLEMGECMQFPLSAITVRYGDYEVFAPLPVYQCPKCYDVLPHKYNIVDKTFRIAICQRHKEKPNDTAA